MGESDSASPAKSPGAKFEEAFARYRTGEFAVAQRLCDAMLAIEPEQPDALHLAGAVAIALGKLASGIGLFRRACQLRPDDAEFQANLGAALLRGGDLPDAIVALEKSTSLNPANASAWNNLANALYFSGATSPAFHAVRRAVELAPDFADGHFNFANMLRAVGRRGEAIESYRHALALRPADPNIAANAAAALAEDDHPDESIAILRAAILTHPNRADLWNNLGNALKDIAQLEEAVDAYRRALKLAPTPRVHSNLIYAMHFHRGSTPVDIQRELQAYEENFARNLPAAAVHSEREIIPSGTSDRPCRLRIGFLCSEFRAHVLGRFILPLFIHHDRSQFEFFAYADSSASDEITALFREHAEHWIPTAHQTDALIAQTIAHDRLDILFDLQLHMARNRLLVFARKPAHIHATYCGYPGSTGLSAVDFRITDPVLDPPDAMAATIEKPIRLPNTYWCYDPDVFGYIGPRRTIWEELPVNPLPALNNGYLTFGCLNNFCKIDCEMLALWASAMQAAPNSRLLMMAPPGSARQGVLRTMQANGIAADRIGFVGRQARTDYFRTYHAIDIALDTLPANGHTTSLDALWMGVPVITRVGSTAMGRATWSQLLNLDLTALAADDDAQFAKIAGQLASDLPALAQLRASLRGRMRASPLTDARQFTRDFENLCRQMYREATAT